MPFIKAVYMYLYSICLYSQEFLQEQALSMNWQLVLVRNLTLCLKFCALSLWVISTFQGIFTCLYTACIVFTSDCGTEVQSCVVRSGLMLLLHDLARQEWVFLPFPKFCIFSRPFRLRLFMCGVTT